jgi:hypothetical protein
VVVLRRFGLGECRSSGTLFLHLLWRVPGRLSGPLRLGIASYSHSLFLRRQLLHSGLVESHRIFRARLKRTYRVKEVPVLVSFIDKRFNENKRQMKGTHQRRQAMTTGFIPFRGSRELLVGLDIEGSDRSGVATVLDL